GAGANRALLRGEGTVEVCRFEGPAQQRLALGHARRDPAEPVVTSAGARASYALRRAESRTPISRTSVVPSCASVCGANPGTRSRFTDAVSASRAPASELQRWRR